MMFLADFGNGIVTKTEMDTKTVYDGNQRVIVMNHIGQFHILMNEHNQSFEN